MSEEKRNEALLQVKNLKKYFKTNRGMLLAVDDVSFDIEKGEALGLVGESGCGKSTTGRAILRLHEPTDGQVIFDGQDVCGLGKRSMKLMRQRMQIVFQDPYSSLNPRRDVKTLIGDSLEATGRRYSREETEKKVLEAMDMVGLEKRLLNAYPHELDGGRRQRIGIARALILNPDFIVLDEPVSALDVCVQAQILNLLGSLRKELGLTYLFISHNLAVVKHISNRIAVMYLGKIVEIADSRTIFAEPKHPYTQALLSAIPIPEVDHQRERIILEGDVSSPIDPPPGCRFRTRCRYAKPICAEVCPELKKSGNSMVACHMVESE